MSTSFSRVQIRTRTNIKPEAGGATKTLTIKDFGKIVNLDTAANTVITLPTVGATGSGGTITFIVTVVPTGGGHVIQCTGNASDSFQGTVYTCDSATVTGYSVGNTLDIDTITLNGTTTGGLNVGDTIIVRDSALNVWSVLGFTNSSGTAATPFSDAT